MSGLLTVPLFEDETLPSFLGRVARANSQHKISVICADLGFNARALRDGDIAELNRFAPLCNKDAVQLGFHALRRDDNGSSTFRGLRYENTLLNRNVRFCPACLMDDERNSCRMPGSRRYQRFAWMIGALRACLKHQCEIVESSGPRFDDLRGEWLNQVELVEEGARLESLVRRREATHLDHFIMDRTEDLRRHGGLLDSLSLGAAIALCEYIGVALRYGKHHPVSILDENEKSVAANHAYRLLVEGESGFNAALDIIRGPRVGLRWLRGYAQYGRLYHSLIAGRLGEAMPHILNLLSRHSETATKHEAAGADVKFAYVQAYGNLDTAAATHDQALDYLRRRRSDASDEPSLDANSLLKGSISEDQAAEILRCGVPLLRKLSRLTVICPIFPDCSAEDEKYQLRRYGLSDIAAFQQKLKDCAQEASEKTIKMLELRTVSTAAKKLDIEIEQVLAFIATGELQGSRQLSDGYLDQVIYVDIGNLKRLLAKTDGFTIEEVVDYLCLPRAEVTEFVRVKALSFGVYGETRFEIFDRKTVEEFKKRYVTVVELQQEHDGKGKLPTWSRLKSLRVRREFEDLAIKSTIVERAAAETALTRQRLYPGGRRESAHCEGTAQKQAEIGTSALSSSP